MGAEIPLTSVGAILAATKSGSVTPLSTRLVDNMDALSGRDNKTNIDTRISDNLSVDEPTPAPVETTV